MSALLPPPPPSVRNAERAFAQARGRRPRMRGPLQYGADVANTRGGASNTPPLETIGNVCNAPLPGAVRCLPVVCDTFHASFDGALAPWLLATLGEAAAIVGIAPLTWDPIARRAVLYNPETASPHGWTVKRCDLSGYGGAYEFVARGRGVWDGIVLAFGKPRQEPEAGHPIAPALRRVRVMLGSELLWRHAVKGGSAYDAMRAILDALAMDSAGVPMVIASAPTDEQVKPARIDVCRDHFGYRWTRADLDYFGGRGRSSNRGSVETYKPEHRFWDGPEEVSTYQGAVTATYYIGRRGARNRFMRIYDKTEEAAVTGKLPWLEPLWEQYGRLPGEKVWRCEIEHGSEWLDEHGCRTLAHVVGFERAAWRRYTTAMRHTTTRKGPGVRMTREPSSAVWLALAQLDDGEPSAWVWATRQPSTHVDKEKLAKQAAGCAAKLGSLFTIPVAEGHPVYGSILPATALTPSEVRQKTIEFLRPLIEGAIRKQSEEAIEALTEQIYEREMRYIQQEKNP